MRTLSPCRRAICILLCLLLLLSCSGCKKESFRPPTNTWLNSMYTLMTQCAAENPVAYSGAVESLMRESAYAKAEILELKTLDRYPNAKAFLLVAMQFADVFAQEPERLLLDYPNYWVIAVWSADSILSAVSHAESEEAYLSDIDRKARVWLEGFYRAANGEYRVIVPEEIPWNSEGNLS